MAKEDGCYVCGDCWWVHCPLPADYTMDVNLKRNGRPLYSGEVELCGGHARLARGNGGHLDLEWLAIEQATALQKKSA